MKRPETVLVRAAALWTAIGLAGGLGYRELTKIEDFTGWTQLSVVHTHALVLGTVVLLLVLALQRVFRLSEDRRYGWFMWTWNIGLALTVAGLTIKGVLQVIGSPSATSAALAGVSGLGHIVLTVAFVLFFIALGARVRLGELGQVEQVGQAGQAGQAGVEPVGAVRP